MSRIPKRAQRAIDAANRARAARATETVASIAPAMTTPRRLQVGVTPQAILPMFEVYFNGQQQFLCRVADVDTGTIVRWTHGKGHKPAKDATLETVHGTI